MKIYCLDRQTIVRDFYDYSVIKGLKDSREFNFTVSRYGYYVVQLVVLPSYDSKGVNVKVESLYGDGKEIDKAITCFNTQGVDVKGNKFNNKLPLLEGELKPIFIGCDFQKAELGNYYTFVTIDDQKVKLNFTLTDELVFNEGYDKGSTLARLNWLNSTAFRDKKIVKDYEAIVAEKNSLSFTGKKVSFTSDGLIENVESYYGESNALEDEVTKTLFSRPIELYIEGQKVKYNKIKLSTRTNRAYVSGDGRSEKLKVEINAKATYEGLINYELKLTAEKDAILPNVKVNFYFGSATYLSGFGREGGRLEENVDYKWSSERPCGNLFIGDVNCGAVIRFKNNMDDTSTPIYNLYSATPYAVPKESWDNYGKGGITLTRTEEGATLCAYTGKKIIKQGDSIYLYFDISLTPFKPINLKDTFGNRLCTDGVELTYASMLNRAKQDDVKYVCLRNAGVLNPYINYPFDKVEELKALAMEAHRNNIGLGINYGLGEMSTRAKETFVYKALGNEIIYRTDKKTDTEKVLIDYLGDGAVEANKITFLSGAVGQGKDMSYYTVPRSRMDNFFVEGVNYLIHYADLDAISMKNPSISRTTAERVAKCIRSKRTGTGVMELEISNRYNDKNGHVNALNAYVNVLPFVNKLYIGEGYDIGRGPDYVLTEASGVIYGLCADTHVGAGITRSLVYGMMPKYGDDEAYSRAIGDINKLFSDFDVENAVFKGFWDSTNPFKVDNAKVYCSTFINCANMIAVFYNANAKTTTFEVGIENKFGYTTLGKKVRAPEIEGMQSAKRVNFGKAMKLKAGQGLIVYVKK
ncbi:MAG: hypothetical protein IKB56_00760 [Clostridia bacterium]|nr:hypothetical protein [Clostridia bacterium]